MVEGSEVVELIFFFENVCMPLLDFNISRSRSLPLYCCICGQITGTWLPEGQVGMDRLGHVLVV